MINIDAGNPARTVGSTREVEKREPLRKSGHVLNATLLGLHRKEAVAAILARCRTARRPA